MLLAKDHLFESQKEKAEETEISSQKKGKKGCCTHRGQAGGGQKGDWVKRGGIKKYALVGTK